MGFCKAINIHASFRSIETVQECNLSLIPLESAYVSTACCTEPIVSSKRPQQHLEPKATPSTPQHLHTMWRTRGEILRISHVGQEFHMGIVEVGACSEKVPSRVALARYCMQARQVLFVPSGNSPGSHGMAGLAGLGLFRRRLLVFGWTRNGLMILYWGR
jgi:hypothetical protein